MELLAACKVSILPVNMKLLAACKNINPADEHGTFFFLFFASKIVFCPVDERRIVGELFTSNSVERYSLFSDKFLARSTQQRAYYERVLRSIREHQCERELRPSFSPKKRRHCSWWSFARF